jgi:hypothetical protein
VSTKTLKVVTTIMMVLCAGSLVLWPVLLGASPGPNASIAANKAYAYKFAGYIGIMVLFLVLSGIGAIWILRRTAAEYRTEQMENMRALVEATLADHQRTHDQTAMD